MRRHYEVSETIRLRDAAHSSNLFSVGKMTMFVIRLYIAALTLTFLSLVVVTHSLGILQATVITCAIVYLILDVRADLQTLRAEFRLLEELEQKVCALLRSNP
jgi:hypothetical protein